MAVKRIATKPTAAPAAVNTPSPHDPLDWLYLNPVDKDFIAEPGFSFGVLRRAYRGRLNSAAEFCRRKGQPVDPPGANDAIPWAITAERIEVLLPPDADDRLLDPRLLCEEADARSVEGEQALLTYVTIAFPNARRLHECWEEARAFALSCFTRQRGLAIVRRIAPGRATMSIATC
jgi:hypothetical protein